MSNQGPYPNSWNNTPQGQNQPQVPNQPQFPNQPQVPNQQWQQFPAQPQQPAGTPPPPNTAAPDGTEPPKKKSKLAIIIAVIAVIALVISGSIYFFTQTDAGKKLAEMTYIGATDQGPEAFMDPKIRQDLFEDFQSTEFSVNDYRGGVDGSSDFIYGSFDDPDVSICRASQLINTASGDNLKEAFAHGLGVSSDRLKEYLQTLSPVMLMHDTWVTAHRYVEHQAIPYQAVLQAGTAVMVDAKGVPRVRCAGGQPLAEAWAGYTLPTQTDSAWDNYEPNYVIAVTAAKDNQTTLRTVNLEDNGDATIKFSPTDRTLQDRAVRLSSEMTVPDDMNVRPDKDLLEEFGMDVASDGSKRQTDPNRFAGFENGFGSPASSPRADSSSDSDDDANRTPAAAPSPSEEPTVEEEPEVETINLQEFREKLRSAQLPETQYLGAGTMSNGKLDDGSGHRLVIGAYEQLNYVGMDGVQPLIGDINGDGKEEAIVELSMYPGGAHMWKEWAIYDGDANLLGYLGNQDWPHEAMAGAGRVMPDKIESFEIVDGNIAVSYSIQDPGASWSHEVSRTASAVLKWEGDRSFSVVSGPN